MFSKINIALVLAVLALIGVMIANYLIFKDDFAILKGYL